MAFEAETGTGSATANSLADVAFADTFHADRGNTAWAALSNDQKQQSLIKATDYLCNLAVFPWKGLRKAITQALCWPRTDVVETNGPVVADNVVPLQVQKACAILALVSTTQSLQPVTSPQPAGIRRRKIDVLEVEYFSPEDGMLNPATQTLQVTEALGLVQALLTSGSKAIYAALSDLPEREEITRAERPYFYGGQHDNTG